MRFRFENVIYKLLMRYTIKSLSHLCSRGLRGNFETLEASQLMGTLWLFMVGPCSHFQVSVNES